LQIKPQYLFCSGVYDRNHCYSTLQNQFHQLLLILIVSQEVQSLQLNQEETDSRVIMYCNYALEHGYDHVRIRPPDSDLIFILLYYAPNLNITPLFDTCSGNKRRLLNITSLAHDNTHVYCAALLALHGFTRYNMISAFKGIGKVKPIKLFQKTPQFHTVFEKLGECWDASDDLHLQLQDFVCLMYIQPMISHNKCG